MANEDLRKALKEADVYYWQVADVYGLSDTNFSKLLRKELPKDKKARILRIVEELAKRKGR